MLFSNVYALIWLTSATFQGIYPTLLVVVISLAKSNIEKTLATDAPQVSDDNITPKGPGLGGHVYVDTCTDSSDIFTTTNGTGNVLVLGKRLDAFDSSSEYSGNIGRRNENKHTEPKYV